MKWGEIGGINTRFRQKYTHSNFESLNNLKISSFFEMDLVISRKLLIFVSDLLIKILKLCSISI